MKSSRLHLGLTLAALAVCASVPMPVAAASFTATNLVSDDAGLHPASITDAGLVNAWGLAYSPTGPFWASSNGTGQAQVYRVNPSTQATTKVGLTVAIPGIGNVTGQVFNSVGASAFNGDAFLFVSEDGTVSGWRGALGTTAEVLSLSNPVNLYKGSAAAPTLSGAFTDPNLPSGYAPFNVQKLGNALYVAYAKQDPNSNDEVAGAGLGIVDSFDVNGNFLGRIGTGGTLDAPWGLAIAPASFGAMAGALLVGNFGDGRISAFNPVNHAFLGQVLGANGQPLEIDGLWALSPGNDGGAGSSQSIYFTAGPNEEQHGVFGVLTAVPEPQTTALMLVGLAALGVVLRRRVSRRP